MSILDFIDINLVRYGLSGDRSFEYFGIDISDGNIINQKLYRRGTGNALAALRNKKPYCCFIQKLSEFTEKNQIEICDFSENVFCGEQSFRMTFRFPQNVSFERGIKLSYSFFETLEMQKAACKIQKGADLIYSTLNTDYSPFMQAGIETDSEGNIQVIKYYLSIKRKLYNSNRLDKDILYLLEKWFEIFNIGDSVPSEKIGKICRNGYYPIFIGVNDEFDKAEHKLYFITEYLPRTTDVYKKTSCLLKDMEWETCLTDSTVKKFLELRLYPEGIAISLNEKKDRIYLNYLPLNLR